MASEQEIFQIVTVILSVGVAILVFWISRRLSSEVETRAEKMREIRVQMGELQHELVMKDTIIEEKEHETQSMKSELEEREKKIAELQQRLKVAEKVSERDLENIRNSLSEIQAVIRTIISRMEEREGQKK